MSEFVKPEAAGVFAAIYGEWFDEKMQARIARDKIKVPVYAAYISQRHYAVRGYVLHEADGRAYSFKLRRDGKVERSWGALEPGKVLRKADAGLFLKEGEFCAI